jgi:hypothetical protein
MDNTPGEIALPGGNVGGAVRIGDTVRRPTGPWTPAVHGLLNYLADAGLAGVPRVLGIDEQDREILDYLPGRTFDTVTETVPEEILAAALRWLRGYHDVVAAYRPSGVLRWRTFEGVLGPDEIICMHDFGGYNWVYDENGFAGVIDWDMAGPGKPLQDIAYAAWNTVPLAQDVPPEFAAHRLRLMSAAYGRFEPSEILYAAPARAMRSVRLIRAGAQAGDPGMLNLVGKGVPEHVERAVAQLELRLPKIAALL